MSLNAAASRRGLLALLMLLAHGCVQPGRFECDERASGGPRPCGELGVCVAGLCASADSACETGWRYGESAGERAGQCASCTEVNDPCCAGTCNGPGLVCDRSSSIPTCIACGNAGQPCCEGTAACGDSLSCVGGICSCLAQVVVASHGYSCARAGDGTAWCWGANPDGQLGTGSVSGPESCPMEEGGALSCSKRPVPVKEGQGQALREVAQLALGLEHGCALKRDGTVVCWGSNRFGQLGRGSASAAEPTPAPVSDPAGGAYVEVVAGALHTCGRKDDGSVWCWGHNPGGILGDGHPASESCAVAGSEATPCRPSPRQVVDASGAPLGEVVGLAAGQMFTCALQRAGSVLCWGYNDSGQLGDGTLTARSHPSSVLLTSGERLDQVVQLAAGDAHVCARRHDGTAWCWGVNSREQLALGVHGGPRLCHVNPLGFCSVHPYPVLDEDEAMVRGLVDLAAGSDHTCARRLDGSVLCWGANQHGQLGDGMQLLIEPPREVKGLPVALGVAAGGGQSCVWSADGDLRCWGANDLGQLGDGTTELRSQPVRSLLGEQLMAIPGCGVDASPLALPALPTEPAHTVSPPRVELLSLGCPPEADHENDTPSTPTVVNGSGPPPVAMLEHERCFTFVPHAEDFGTGAAIPVDSAGSTDPDGRVEACRLEWKSGATPWSDCVGGLLHAGPLHLPGLYRIKLTVRDDSGQEAQITGLFALVAPGHPAPANATTVMRLDAGPDQIAHVGHGVHFDFSGSWDGDPDQNTPLWCDWGDGTVGCPDPFEAHHHYTAPGVYRAQFRLETSPEPLSDEVTVVVLP